LLLRGVNGYICRTLRYLVSLGGRICPWFRCISHSWCTTCCLLCSVFPLGSSLVSVNTSLLRSIVPALHTPSITAPSPATPSTRWPSSREDNCPPKSQATRYYAQTPFETLAHEGSGS